jgi:hypothetical protein
MRYRVALKGETSERSRSGALARSIERPHEPTIRTR